MSTDLPTPGAPLMLIVSVRGLGLGLAVVDPPDITLKIPLRPITSACRRSGGGASREYVDVEYGLNQGVMRHFNEAVLVGIHVEICISAAP